MNDFFIINLVHYLILNDMKRTQTATFVGYFVLERSVDTHILLSQVKKQHILIVWEKSLFAAGYSHNYIALIIRRSVYQWRAAGAACIDQTRHQKLQRWWEHVRVCVSGQLPRARIIILFLPPRLPSCPLQPSQECTAAYPLTTHLLPSPRQFIAHETFISIFY